MSDWAIRMAIECGRVLALEEVIDMVRDKRIFETNAETVKRLNEIEDAVRRGLIGLRYQVGNMGGCNHDME